LHQEYVVLIQSEESASGSNASRDKIGGDGGRLEKGGHCEWACGNYNYSKIHFLTYNQYVFIASSIKKHTGHLHWLWAAAFLRNRRLANAESSTFPRLKIKPRPLIYKKSNKV
jgi:hypothetical protein